MCKRCGEIGNIRKEKCKGDKVSSLVQDKLSDSLLFKEIPSLVSMTLIHICQLFILNHETIKHYALIRVKIISIDVIYIIEFGVLTNT